MDIPLICRTTIMTIPNRDLPKVSCFVRSGYQDFKSCSRTCKLWQSNCTKITKLHYETIRLPAISYQPSILRNRGVNSVGSTPILYVYLQYSSDWSVQHQIQRAVNIYIPSYDTFIAQFLYNNFTGLCSAIKYIYCRVFWGLNI